MSKESANKPGSASPDTENSPKVTYEVVSPDSEGQRIDNFLIKKLKGVPKSKIYQIIRKGEVRVDKKRVKQSDKLVEGQTIRIPPIRVAPSNEGKIASELNLDKNQELMSKLADSILFEDQNILVINKPSGLAVHGGSGISLGLIELVRAIKSKEGGSPFLELVHRLDKDTSGCIVLAKKASALRELHGLIKNGKIQKHYLALVSGRWKGASHKVEAPLLKVNLNSGERVVRVSRDGKPSLTLFTVKERFTRSTLVDAELLTGRTHQIRVHCQFSGHPILGDPKYGYPEENEYFNGVGLNRLFLHAHTLVLPLSIYSTPLEIKAPLPAELESVLTKLRGERDD